jgi:hypothetical protein
VRQRTDRSQYAPQDAPSHPETHAMTHQQEIDMLRQRLDDAQGVCDSCRLVGPEEKYIEADVIVKALALELDEKLCQPDR